MFYGDNYGDNFFDERVNWNKQRRNIKKSYNLQKNSKGKRFFKNKI